MDDHDRWRRNRTIKQWVVLALGIGLVALGFDAITAHEDFLLSLYVIAGSAALGVFMWKVWDG